MLVRPRSRRTGTQLHVDLMPGPQFVRMELEDLRGMRTEFRDGETRVP